MTLGRERKRMVDEATVRVQEQLMLEAGRKLIANWDGESYVHFTVSVHMEVQFS